MTKSKNRAPRTMVVGATLIAVGLLVGCEQPPIIDPTYAEIRLTYVEQEDVKLAVFIKTESAEACKVAIEEFFEDAEIKDDKEWRSTKVDCKKTIHSKYVKTFDNQAIHATYMLVDRKGGWTHDARMIFFGIPSTQAASACDEVSQYFGSRLGADVACIKGSVG